MERPAPGRYEPIVFQGVAARAFVPVPLPPDPALEVSGLLDPLEQAGRALGGLDRVSALLPEKDLFLYTYVRKEAVLSSQIEGTQSSLSDLLLFELEQAPGAPFDDVIEVSRYVAALGQGLRLLDQEGLPLCNRVFRELHRTLLAEGRGSDLAPGEFRRSQVWVGDRYRSIEHASFVPPPPEQVEGCMADLERFLNRPPEGLPLLFRAGLAHAQFETIHPFLDGNGRLGRMLITLMLHSEGALHEPLLYLSLYFKQHRLTYYELLNRVRTHGDWESWLRFFLEGVTSVANEAMATAQALQDLGAHNEQRIRADLGRTARTGLAIHRALQERPVLTIGAAATRAGVVYATAQRRLEDLARLGIVREVTGRKRDRVFVYDEYLRLLNEDTSRRG